MRILITGGTGFIGERLLPLLAAEHEVWAMARTTPADEVPPGVEWLEQDLARPFDRGRLPRQIDAVVHLAQSKEYRDFPGGAPDVFAINVASTFELLEYAKVAGAHTFVLASTGGVYGSSQTTLTETDRLNPLNFYFSSKYSAELLLTSYRSVFRPVVFRFFFVYGPGQQGMLIPSLLQKVLSGDTIVVEGNPGLRINPIYVEDAVRVFEPSLRLAAPGLFNVAGDDVVTVTELVELMQRLTGKQARIEHAPASADGDLIGDNTRMKEILGVRPSVSLQHGLRTMT